MGRTRMNLSRLKNIENQVIIKKTFLPKLNKPIDFSRENFDNPNDPGE